MITTIVYYTKDGVRREIDVPSLVDRIEIVNSNTRGEVLNRIVTHIYAPSLIPSPKQKSS